MALVAIVVKITLRLFELAAINIPLRFEHFQKRAVWRSHHASIPVVYLGGSYGLKYVKCDILSTHLFFIFA
ncbi:hypothetical protein D1BOALGB6SA_5033 [Olavius sp. associated proteobacterium Delta 1]|nr:hypothetical protein D1BOALGB6SA_5033 [Olavius sp. associated proteobacterium Delta 1]